MTKPNHHLCAKNCPWGFYEPWFLRYAGNIELKRSALQEKLANLSHVVRTEAQ
jgi:hypothetical protein